MQGFRTYQSAVELYRTCQGLKLKGHLRDQLMRASSSIVLNLAEGSSQPSRANRCRFYAMAMGSLREVQAIIDLENLAQIRHSVDRVGGQLYRLLQANGKSG